MKSSSPISLANVPILLWLWLLPIMRCLAQEGEEMAAEMESTASDATDDSSGCIATEDSVTLRNTCKLYGSIFLVVFVLFCLLRRRYIKTYAIRSWGNHQSSLANPDYGYLEWIYKLAFISDEDLLKEEINEEQQEEEESLSTATTTTKRKQKSETTLLGYVV